MTHALRSERTENVQEEETSMKPSFSVEDLLDEVEKISSVPTGGKKVGIVVRLWKDGFTVNDEDLRSYTLEENQEFLEAIKRGELPLELEGRAEEQELEVNVEDMKDEMYVPKKKTFHPFTGRGYRLGSVAPRVVARSRSVHEDLSTPPVPAVEVDEEQPVTALQIWLADGRRLVQRFNLSHRISDVQDFVEQAQRTSSPFILTTSLPFRELREEEQSIEEADLTNAVIVQRPLNTQNPFGHS
ncbi:UBX domain-containing protein 2A isoform X2 [Chanos chanos]|uniref:UBX domain-containing protein 2A isoform X2 n=1 Tax=Chanos chanos TaxID=29144 RepID=A0A6J2V5X7_CHACN|nr:UBX domain-containing protein 2A isoform X2 [Chanos chanos]